MTITCTSQEVEFIRKYMGEYFSYNNNHLRKEPRGLLRVIGLYDSAKTYSKARIILEEQLGTGSSWSSFSKEINCILFYPLSIGEKVTYTHAEIDWFIENYKRVTKKDITDNKTILI